MNGEAPSIVFFSRDGNTRYIAEATAHAIGAARLVEIIDGTRRRGVIGFIVGGLDARRQANAPLVGDPWGDVAGAGRIVLMTPIWAGNGTPAINAFLSRASLDGAEVHTVTVQADPNLGSAPAVHAYLAGLIRERGGTPTGSTALAGATPGKRADEALLQSQVMKLLRDLD